MGVDPHKKYGVQRPGRGCGQKFATSRDFSARARLSCSVSADRIHTNRQKNQTVRSGHRSIRYRVAVLLTTNKAHVTPHATKSSNFVVQLFCSTKVAQLLTSRATKLTDRNHLYSSAVCNLSLRSVAEQLWLVNCLFMCSWISLTLSNIHLTPLYSVEAINKVADSVSRL